MKIKVIQIFAQGAQFAKLLPESIHEVVEPPNQYKKKFPNNDSSVWVMGTTEPVRIFIKGRVQEAIILNDETEPATDTGKS